MSEGLKAGVRPSGHNLTSDQRMFLVHAFARYMTTAEARRAWEERWPDAPFPAPPSIYRYRPPLVLQGPHAEAFTTERDRYRADLPAFAEKHKRLECLHEMAESLRGRIDGLQNDERREVTADLYDEEAPKRAKKGTVRTIRATRAELERDLRQTLSQIDDEMGKVIKLEHSGSVTLSYLDLLRAATQDKTDGDDPTG